MFLSVVPDEDPMDPSEDPAKEPSGARTPPTPPAGGAPSQSRQRAMAQLRPVSEATLICMEPSTLIRYGSCCNSAPAYHVMQLNYCMQHITIIVII